MLIPFEVPLTPARLIKRYKRFLADVQLEDGRELTVHCPNTGSMRNCGQPGDRVWLRLENKPGRKLPGGWELAAALQAGLITPLAGYTQQRAEVSLRQGGSRFDFLLSDPDECVVEVKSVTLALGAGEGAFPDAVSARGQKHLIELTELAANGRRACLLFCVMHSGIDRVRPADEIDPEYGRLLRAAVAAGVAVLAWSVWPTPQGLQVRGELPVLL